MSEPQPLPPDTFTVWLFLLALVLVFVGLSAAASWGVACAVLGGILLGVVLCAKLTARRPVE